MDSVDIQFDPVLRHGKSTSSSDIRAQAMGRVMDQVWGQGIGQVRDQVTLVRTNVMRRIRDQVSIEVWVNDPFRAHVLAQALKVSVQHGR